jgi:taurine dioxygenase
VLAWRRSPSVVGAYQRTGCEETLVFDSHSAFNLIVEGLLAMKIEPLSDVLGAAVTGLDLTAPLEAEECASLRQALTDHLVICIRNQDLDPPALAAAAAMFGPLKRFVVRQDRMLEAPEVSVVSNRSASLGGKPQVQARHWHTDDSYYAEPATITLLLAKILPNAGGDTEFINAYKVLEALPVNFRHRIEGLRAVHMYRARRNVSPVADQSPEEAAETPPVDHPLIRTNPGSGRQSLYINPNRIDHIQNWTELDSDALLEALYAHAFQPEFQYRHSWRPGDLILWDNRCTLHRANADYDISQPRIMHRVMLAGEVPV